MNEERILEDVKRWEARPPQGAPKLLVVSTGTAEANEATGLSSPVLLDEGSHAGSTFGANGTSMAVLVDAEGKIASEAAAGAPAVLTLAGQNCTPLVELQCPHRRYKYLCSLPLQTQAQLSGT